MFQLKNWFMDIYYKYDIIFCFKQYRKEYQINKKGEGWFEIINKQLNNQ